ncbi:hypothetical protein SLEP1_g12949 [Rubroshorea leprosula]|uniref:Uncharacterized protein n=1 Tax=Rubroshorea leprosula TaxID=152421 RepID=A0AAV5IE67_9ROSI|nr:hypothetical protein SLEP1_g12949 [Rubroshorea leprosula]
MERNRSTDELAAVKAAAWAWYERGSGSQGKPIREYDITARAQSAVLRPSRYKLEAMLAAENSSLTASPVHSCANSLLDAYEIESISKHLDHLIDSCRTKSYTDGHEKKKKSWSLKKVLPRHPVLCGTRQDAVTTAFRVNRTPEKADGRS